MVMKKMKSFGVHPSTWAHWEVGKSILWSNWVPAAAFFHWQGQAWRTTSHGFVIMESFRTLISIFSAFCSIFCIVSGSTFYLHVHVKEEMSWSCDFNMGVKLPIFPRASKFSASISFFLLENSLTFHRHGMLTFGLPRLMFSFFTLF